MTFIIIFVLLVLFILVLSIIIPYREFNHLEVGDTICIKYSKDKNNNIIPEVTTTVVSVKHTIHDNIESITLENGAIINSYMEFINNKWIIIND